MIQNTKVSVMINRDGASHSQATAEARRPILTTPSTIISRTPSATSRQKTRYTTRPSLSWRGYGKGVSALSPSLSNRIAPVRRGNSSALSSATSSFWPARLGQTGSKEYLLSQ